MSKEKITKEEAFQFRIMHAAQIRGTLVTLLFLLILSSFPTAASPTLTWEFYTAASISLAMTIWGVWIGINPYRYELQFTLYAGMLGLGMAAASHMSLYKIMHAIVGLQGSWFIPLAAIGNLILIGVMIYYHHKAFHNGAYYRSEKNGWGAKGGRILGASALGYIVYNLAAALLGDAGRNAAGIFAFSLFAALGSFIGVIFLHKYLFIRQRMDRMLEIHPLLNRPKKERPAERARKKRG